MSCPGARLPMIERTRFVGCVHAAENSKLLTGLPYNPYTFEGSDERFTLLLWSSSQPINGLGRLNEFS